MKRETRKLFESMARANRLNTRGRRKYRSQFRKAMKQTEALVFGVVSRYEGRPINEATRDEMLGDILAALPPTPPTHWVQSIESLPDRAIKVTWTPEAIKLFARGI